MNKEKERQFAERVQYQYTEHGETKTDRLKKLDRAAKKPVAVFAYIFGTIGSLVLGTGMCFSMKVIGDMMIPGIVIGLIGLLMVSVNYGIYKKILNSRKKKYAEQVLKLSSELLNE